MINIASTNGTHVRTFTPTQPYVRVKFLSGNAYSLADMSLVSVDVDTSYSLIARGSYRYGFQGQERDDEIKGAGKSLNFEYRMHDPRIGRFFAIDPLARKYPYWSPYVFSGNQVIRTVELEGLEPEKNLNANEIEYHSEEFIINSLRRGKAGDELGYNDGGLIIYTRSNLNQAKAFVDLMINVTLKTYGKQDKGYEHTIVISKDSELGLEIIESLEENHGIKFKSLSLKEKKSLLRIQWKYG